MTTLAPTAPGHSYDFDFFVIGAGSGGVRASRIAAGLGARVGVVEERFLGGTCVNVGCVPKKLLTYGAHFRDEVHEAHAYGWDVAVAPTHDWARLIATKDKEIARLNRAYQGLLEGRGVQILRGRGVLKDPHTVVVTGPDGAQTTVTAQFILIATGGASTPPQIPGAEHVATSDAVFSLQALPKRVLIQGGGYIGVEMAGILHGYGAHVTLVHRGALFLRGFDRDVRVHLEQCMRARGIDLRFHHDVVRVEKRAGGLRVTLNELRNEHPEVVEADFVLAAIGRAPNTQGIGLEAVGITTSPRGAIPVDEEFRTAQRNIYAVGDVIDRVQLTPVALAEGMLVARNLFGGAGVPRGRADYEAVPSAVFSSPPIGTVGLSEEEARERYGAVDIYKSTFTPMKMTMVVQAHAADAPPAAPPDKTLMKIVVEQKTQRVVGMHVVGPDAGEIVQGFAVAVKMGVTKEQLDMTVGIHPTAAEELVTMREKQPDRDQVLHDDRPRPRRIVHHRFDHHDER